MSKQEANNKGERTKETNSLFGGGVVICQRDDPTPKPISKKGKSTDLLLICLLIGR